MGVYIKGMKMPTSCSRCALFDEGSNGDPDWCKVMHQVPEYGTCPLVPVPPHGALMDRDDFFATCPELVDGYKRITDDLVVIPAEEGE